MVTYYIETYHPYDGHCPQIRFHRGGEITGKNRDRLSCSMTTVHLVSSAKNKDHAIALLVEFLAGIDIHPYMVANLIPLMRL